MHARMFINILLILLLLLPPLAGSLRAEEQDETLETLGRPPSASVSGRLPRLLSRTPENVTVIPASEIAAINAHTLSDVLATVPGIHLAMGTGPASGAFTLIQGSDYKHVLVLLDGITFNNLGDNVADIGLIPARIIERVEIVKGAASSAWGQALGGVINVVTKAPDADRRLGGSASLSHGERGTRDANAELTGTSGKLGYYLAGGYFGSAGFRPNTGVDLGSGHGRLTWELPRQGQLAASITYFRTQRGEFAFTPLDFQSRDEAKRLLLGLNMRQPLSERLELELAARHSINRSSINNAAISNGTPLQSVLNDERVSGGSIKLLWRGSSNLLALGLDYDHARLQASESLFQVDLLKRRADRWGFFLNDTLTIGPVSLSPGVRYDLTGTSGEQFSPSFGATWQLGEQTTLRGYTAKGFSLPAFTLDRGSERVWTTQVGIETSAIPYLWLKATLFRNDTWDITVYDSQLGAFRLERQIKRGFETELRTVPHCNTSLSVGYNYVDARRGTDDSVVKDIPPHTLHLGVRYDDQKRLQAVLLGRHLWWNAEPFRNGRYFGVVWDGQVNAAPWGRGLYQPELFLSLHNIFNTSQYLDEVYKNSGRWFEGGVRVRF